VLPYSFLSASYSHTLALSHEINNKEWSEHTCVKSAINKNSIASFRAK
jgi:hypothetical protein